MTNIERLQAEYAALAKPIPAEPCARKGDVGEVYLYGGIGEEVTSAGFTKSMEAVKGAKVITLYVNSIGGSIFEAKSIMAQIERAKKSAKVVAVIDGIAASAASFILTVADEVHSYPESKVMIHQASTIAAGRAEDFRSMADLLDAENKSMVRMYAAKTKQAPEKIAELMEAETYFTAQEAKDFGLVDKILGESQSVKMAASADSEFLKLAADTQRRILAIRINSLRSKASLGPTSGQAQKTK